MYYVPITTTQEVNMTTSTKYNKAELAIQTHEYLAQQSPSFELSTAGVFAIIEGAEGITFTVLSRHGNIYEALGDALYVETEGSVIGYAMETVGWAAPLKNGEVEGAPSQHPERRRVRLTSIALHESGQASVLEFADTPGEYTTDEGEAIGPLATQLGALLK